MNAEICIGLEIDDSLMVLKGRKEVAMVMEWCRPWLNRIRDTDGEGYEMSIHSTSLKFANQTIPNCIEEYVEWQAHMGGVFVSELKFFTGSEGVTEEQFNNARIFLNRAARTGYDALTQF